MSFKGGGITFHLTIIIVKVISQRTFRCPGHRHYTLPDIHIAKKPESWVSAHECGDGYHVWKGEWLPKTRKTAVCKPVCSTPQRHQLFKTFLKGNSAGQHSISPTTNGPRDNEVFET
jgi:hypothetical protein